jgi:hypothetical protein
MTPGRGTVCVLGCVVLGLDFFSAAGCDVRTQVLAPPGVVITGEAWPAEAARSADAVVETISVGTHLGATTPANDNYAVVKPLLATLGVRHVMELSPQADLTRVQELGGMGIHTQVWIAALDSYFQSALALAGPIDALEVDALTAGVTLDQTWLQGRRNFCGELFAAVKAARVAGVSVVGPDLLVPTNLALVDFGPCVDYGVVHRPKTIGPPTAKNAGGLSLDDETSLQRRLAGAQPLMLGLEGYSTAAGDPNGAVSEIVQAKYLVRLIFEAFNRDFVRVYLGGVTDRPDDVNVQNGVRTADTGAVASGFAAAEGLAHFDGTPKPSFIAAQNIIATLADAGASVTNGALPYRLDGAPATLHHTLLQKRDGTYLLALWQDVVSADSLQMVSITLRFPAAAKKVTTFVPQQAATATNHWENVRDVPIVVGDDVTLVAIAATNYCDRSMWTATASVRGDNSGPPGAIDGDLTTRWDSAHVQNGTDWFQVDFGGSVQLTSITLNNTETFPGDYPGAYEIRGSVDGVSFDGAPFVGGAGTNGSTVVNFAPRAVRAV